MNDLDDAGDELDDPLIVALSCTPVVTPFSGTARYRVCRCLGEGGFGVVYEVEDLELGRRLALKVLKPQRAGFAETMRRLKTEFRSVADLVHPNLVGLHELSTDGARWFFTMELVRGVSFLEHVAQSEPEHRLTRLRAALRQLVTGVIALHHAGIVHRDLTPLNVLVEPDGRVVILDFGLAGRESIDDDAAGTPAYMAPEQRAGLAVTGAADWYAVGVMLYEALTGARAASDDVLAKAPPDLAQLCRALRDPDASRRPSDMHMLAWLGDARAPRSLDERAPFVGREHELEVLRSCSVQRDATQVRIRGQAGVGKSALLARYIEDEREQGVLVLAGRCHEREFLPFKAFDGVADALVRYLRELPRHEAASLMPRDIHLVAPLFPVFDGLTVARDVPRRHASPRDLREARARAFAAIKELLSRVADKQPLTIVVDDLQWGDIDSARLLAHLVAPPDPPAMRLVLAFRDGIGDSPTLDETLRMLALAGGTAVELRLDPMAPADAEQLARCALPPSARAGDTARLIAQRAEGHPLFILELARGLDAGAAIGAPPTLIEFLCRRVARLPAHARSLLETVAVAGQPLPSALCYAAAGTDTNDDALRTLRAEQLVRTTEGGAVNVFHDRIRDAILLHMEVASQQHRHRELARSMERLPDVDLETVARHYDGAGERELAGHYAVRAGDAAVSSLAFDRAAALYRLAIDRGSTDGGALHEKLAAALLNAGSNVSSGEAYLAAAALAEGDRVTELVCCAAEQLLVVGNVEVGLSALEQALAAVGETLPRSRRAARLEMAYHLLRLYMTRWRYRERDAASVSPSRMLQLHVLEAAAKGLYPHDPPRSMAIRARFCRAAFATGEPRRVALGLIHSVYAFSLYRTSRPPVFDEKLDAADAIGVRIHDFSVQAQVRMRRGGTHFVFGDWARSAHFLEEAAAMISEKCVGMATDRRWALMQAGSCYTRMGELAAAQRMGDELLLDAVERGDPVAEKGVCVGVLAPLSLAGDNPDDAAAFVARGGSDDRCATVMLRTESEASVAMYLGRPEDAVSAWRRSWSRVEQVRLLAIAGFRVLAVRSLATALLARPRHRRELREAERLARSIGRLRFPYATATSASLQAAIAVHRGQPARATRLLEEAADDFAAAGMTLDAAACRYRLGRAGARDELRARGIASPERWVAMVLPVSR